jgi:hypothetical protein
MGDGMQIVYPVFAGSYVLEGEAVRRAFDAANTD